MLARCNTLVLIALLVATAHAKDVRRPAHSTAKPSLQVSEADVNNPSKPQIQQGATGSAVLRAQILLDRSHFSCGEIDGRFGINLLTTLRAFQQARSLPITGAVDPATWSALNGDTAPPITEVNLSPQDVQGPFVSIPGDLMQQAKLPWLGYTSPLEELSERFHASPELMRALNPGVDFSRASQQLHVPNVFVAAPGQAARVVVSKGESSVTAYDADGKLLAFYIATTGSAHDPLPVGEWKILGVARNPKFHYNPQLFWDAKKTDDRATIQPGPNNPVGVVWIDLSKEHYGIHGTPEPGKVGHAQSHGCIRLTNWDAAELASMVKPGTPATLQE